MGRERGGAAGTRWGCLSLYRFSQKDAKTTSKQSNLQKQKRNELCIAASVRIQTDIANRLNIEEQLSYLFLLEISAFYRLFIFMRRGAREEGGDRLGGDINWEDEKKKKTKPQHIQQSPR